VRVSMLVSASISSCASPISSKTWSRPPAEAGCLHRTPVRRCKRAGTEHSSGRENLTGDADSRTFDDSMLMRNLD